jgi:hypothetical protein
MTTIATILGSTRPGRNGEAVARWVHDAMLDQVVSWSTALAAVRTP